MRERWGTTFGVVCLCLAALSADCFGAVVTVDASATAALQNPEAATERRLLLRFDVPERLSAGIVELAMVEFRTAFSAADSTADVALDCFEITTPWSAGTADWTESWTTPGGDLDRMRHGVCTAAVSDTSLVRFDVTDMVAGWAADAAANHGVIVAVAPKESAYIATLRGAELRRARLKIWYTPRRDG
ncbi:MAG: DNRLRE domain-containing protein [Candidatus Eisenbacteria bacterium]|nr:DNRLRE domain-containing protein [Candidatus Eisenbacteria bacterium]